MILESRLAMFTCLNLCLDCWLLLGNDHQTIVTGLQFVSVIKFFTKAFPVSRLVYWLWAISHLFKLPLILGEYWKSAYPRDLLIGNHQEILTVIKLFYSTISLLSLIGSSWPMLIHLYACSSWLPFFTNSNRLIATQIHCRTRCLLGKSPMDLNWFLLPSWSSRLFVTSHPTDIWSCLWRKAARNLTERLEQKGKCWSTSTSPTLMELAFPETSLSLSHPNNQPQLEPGCTKHCPQMQLATSLTILQSWTSHWTWKLPPCFQEDLSLPL